MNIVLGAAISLLLYFVAPNYDEYEIYWWFTITAITVFGIIFDRLAFSAGLVVGGLIMDTIISTIYDVKEKKYLNAIFIFIHHLIWGSLLYLNIGAGDRILFWILLGQLAISSVDFVMIYDVNRPFDLPNNFYQLLNLWGRLLLGNYAIYMVASQKQNKIPFWIAGIFNTAIALTLSKSRIQKFYE